MWLCFVNSVEHKDIAQHHNLFGRIFFRNNKKNTSFSLPSPVRALQSSSIHSSDRILLPPYHPWPLTHYPGLSPQPHCLGPAWEAAYRLTRVLGLAEVHGHGVLQKQTKKHLFLNADTFKTLIHLNIFYIFKHFVVPLIIKIESKNVVEN